MGIEHQESLAFVQKKFSEYYSQARISVHNVHAREFGFGFQKKIDYRHKSFASEAELNAFFQSEAPLFASHSTAYYKFPSSRPMEKKVFLGSDLVFDIDKPFFAGEHGHNELLCLHCLGEVKKDAVKLRKILVDDFGFEEKELSVNFSGNKGFHFHLNSEKVLGLSQDARRQLVEYLNGPEALVSAESASAEKEKDLRGPSKNSLGWGKKFFVFAGSFVKSASVEELKKKGLRGKGAEDFFARKEEVLGLMEKGRWLFAPKAFWDNLYSEFKQQNAVGVDAMVTLDLARLIRIPDSLHGDSGFIAKRLSPEELEKFSVFGALAFSNSSEKTINVLPKTSIELDFPGKVGLEAGKPAEVSQALGVFLLCKGRATLLLEEKKYGI
jgi:DNA primase small subunit